LDAEGLLEPPSHHVGKTYIIRLDSFPYGFINSSDFTLQDHQKEQLTSIITDISYIGFGNLFTHSSETLFT
jgi:hypothetical protein